MCGIVGQYNISGESVSPAFISAMCDKIYFRGPDDAGVYTNGAIGLGHRRLSILDLSPLGHQPMSSPDKTVWITFNGEIYNFLELRKDLEKRGYFFRSSCDTEVIIALYQEYGFKCLEHLRGMFALGIWDNARQTLFLARDRIGKKPLFYFHNGQTFIFASEIKCLLEYPGIDRQVDFEALYDYFKYMYVPDPKTIYKGIRKLPPGHFLVYSREGTRVEEYWDISFSHKKILDEQQAAEELLALLEQCVRIRQISDVPLGAFLSGGIDSSGVVALMARQQARPVTTCSIGFDEQAFNETAFARVIAEKYQTDHHEFTVRQNAEKILPKLVYHFDEPFADASAVPTYYVSKLARSKVTVALSGDGGDENFAGYEKYHIDDIENRFRNLLPALLRNTLFPPLSRFLYRMHSVQLQKGATLLAALSRSPDYGFYLTNTDFHDDLWKSVINDDTRRAVADYDPFDVTRHYYWKADTDNHLARILYTDLKTYLPGGILVKVDRMSMANSLEVRAPILDHRIVEFAASLPEGFKYRHGEKKYILKQAFKKILPDEIMYRPKMGFSIPLSTWFRGELKTFAHKNLTGEESGLKHFFNQSALLRIWEDHQTGKRDYSNVLWRLLLFELWFQEFLT